MFPYPMNSSVRSVHQNGTIALMFQVAVPSLLERLVILKNNNGYHLLDHPDRVWSIDVSTDGRFVASGCRDEKARIWQTDAVSHSPVIIPHGVGYVWSVQFSPSGSFLATGGYDGYVRFWRLGGTPVGDRKKIDDPNSRTRNMPGLIVNFTTDGRLHAGGEDWGEYIELPAEVT